MPSITACTVPVACGPVEDTTTEIGAVSFFCLIAEGAVAVTVDTAFAIVIGTVTDVPVVAPVRVSSFAPIGAPAGNWTETVAVP